MEDRAVQATTANKTRTPWDCFEREWKLTSSSENTAHDGEDLPAYARQFTKHYKRSLSEMGRDGETRITTFDRRKKEDLAGDLPANSRGADFSLHRQPQTPHEVDHLPIRRNKVKLPVVPSGTEVCNLLEAIRSR